MCKDVCANRPGEASADVHLTIRLRLDGYGGQRRWQVGVEGDADARQHIESLPDLIAWLARLQWQTCGASGVK